VTAGPSWAAPGRSRVATFVTVPNAEGTVAFATAVFGAVSRAAPMRKSDGTLWNIEMNIGDSTIMISRADGDMVRPGFLYVTVPDAAATLARAVAHGATRVMPVERRFYGADDGGGEDPAGNWWWISTNVEDLTDEQIADRARTAEKATR